MKKGPKAHNADECSCSQCGTIRIMSHKMRQYLSELLSDYEVKRHDVPLMVCYLLLKEIRESVRKIVGETSFLLGNEEFKRIYDNLDS